MRAKKQKSKEAKKQKSKKARAVICWFRDNGCNGLGLNFRTGDRYSNVSSNQKWNMGWDFAQKRRS
jgi:hypothetical protein